MNAIEDVCHFNVAIKEILFMRSTANKQQIKFALANGYLSFTPTRNAYKYLLDLINKIDLEHFDSLSYNIANTLISIILTEVITSTQLTPISQISEFCFDAIAKINDGTVIDKSPAQIYKQYPVSHTAFIQEFKRITGKTPINYLNECKMNYAKDLLINTRMQIVAISLEIGYDSLSYFIKKFTQTFGITPLKYRKLNKIIKR